jgi:hypothetical protein
MAALQKFNSFSQQCLMAQHNFTTSGPHVFKLALTPTAPDVTDTDLAGVAGTLPGTGGYPSGGAALTHTLSLTGAVAKVAFADVTFTATAGTGSIGPFRYGAIYNSSNANKVVAWFDHGASITLAAGEVFTVDFDAANGAFTLA